MSYYEVNIIINFTLGLIAFVIGGSFTIDFLNLLGKSSILVMSLAGILICVGLAEIFRLSAILACMLLGATFINLVPMICRTFFEIVESISPPIYIIFFIVAGLKLRPDLLIEMGVRYAVNRAGEEENE